jgi:hypothetical protein
VRVRVSPPVQRENLLRNQEVFLCYKAKLRLSARRDEKLAQSGAKGVSEFTPSVAEVPVQKKPLEKSGGFFYVVKRN